MLLVYSVDSQEHYAYHIADLAEMADAVKNA